MFVMHSTLHFKCKHIFQNEVIKFIQASELCKCVSMEHCDCCILKENVYNQMKLSDQKSTPIIMAYTLVCMRFLTYIDYTNNNEKKKYFQ